MNYDDLPDWSFSDCYTGPYWSDCKIQTSVKKGRTDPEVNWNIILSGMMKGTLLIVAMLIVMMLMLSITRIHGILVTSPGSSEPYHCDLITTNCVVQILMGQEEIKL
jgi:hypothetical protein